MAVFVFEHLIVMCTRAATIGVLGEEGHPGEGLTTGGTRVLLHFRMRLEVRPQVGPVGESPVTVLTREGFLAGVRPDMSLQQPRPTERLAAQLALAGESVGSDVHL